MSDGGPAFPIYGLNADGCKDNLSLGLSLRDWFAGTIPVSQQDIDAMCMSRFLKLSENCSASEAQEVEAQMRYRMADAMLAERSKLPAPGG